jgi:protein NEDD1
LLHNLAKPIRCHILQSKEEGEINTMAVTPSRNVVLGVWRKVIVLEYATGSAKILKTFESHGTTITALAVCMIA